jgi:hypothetical protein
VTDPHAAAYLGEHTVRTTTGETFTGEEHAQLAALLLKRFGWDVPAAAAAWRRMLGNSSSDGQFETLAYFAVPAVRRGLR